MAELRRPPDAAPPVDPAQVFAAVDEAVDLDSLATAMAAAAGANRSAGGAARRRLFELLADDPTLARRLRAIRRPPVGASSEVQAMFRLHQLHHVAERCTDDTTNHNKKDPHQ